MDYFSGVSFYLREKGIKRCPAGSEVMDQDECKEACTSLGIRLSNTFKNGKPCFKAGNGVCKQSGSIGSKALLVCKEAGKSFLSSTSSQPAHHKCLVDALFTVYIRLYYSYRSYSLNNSSSRNRGYFINFDIFLKLRFIIYTIDIT